MTRPATRRAVAAAALLVASAPASAAQDAADVFELVPVTEGVWATTVREGISPSQYAASVIVVRGDHALVVDSRHGPAAAADLIATIRELTPLPVRYLVCTHWHGDHVQGNQAFREAFPDLRIVGGATLAEDMATLGRTRLDEDIERRRTGIDTGRRWLEADTRDDATALSDEDRTRIGGEIERLQGVVAELESVELVPPDLIVDDVLELDDAEPLVRVIRMGPAHTRGDVIVHLPGPGVLALGDLVEDGFPWFGDGTPRGWARALDRVAALEAEIHLPAHGPVLREPGMVEMQHRFVRAVVKRAAEAAAEGATLEAALADDPFAAFEAHFTRRLSDLTLAERAERFDAFVLEVFELALAEASAEVAAGTEGLAGG